MSWFYWIILGNALMYKDLHIRGIKLAVNFWHYPPTIKQYRVGFVATMTTASLMLTVQRHFEKVINVICISL